MPKLLCLGDSITDAHRLFQNPPLGCGYVSFISEKLMQSGYDLAITNLGTDGFTLSRILDNCSHLYLPINADIISILIGINDLGLMMNTNRTSGQQQTMMERFFINYEKLILTFQGKSLILMEPFIFSYPAEFLNWFPLLRQMSAGICTLAEKYRIPYIRLHDVLNEAAKTYGLDSVTTDGIHLTSLGHEIVSEKLLHTLKTYV